MSIQTIEATGGHRIEVEYDDCPENPREWHNVWTILTAQSRHLDIDGTYHEGAIPEDADMVVPVYRYEHGAVLYRAGDENPFSCPWDSGQIGVAYLPFGTLSDEWPNESVTGAKEKARACLDGELSAYTAWANGEVYAYTVFDPDGDIIDGCSGFFPDESGDVPAYMVEQATDAVMSSLRRIEKEREERAYWEARDVRTVEA